MELKVINSNSKGNCYILKDSNENRLIIECGVSKEEIMHGTDFNLKSITGILLSHEHL